MFPLLSANCLCVVTTDGSLRIVHADTFESRVAQKGPVMAMATDESPVPLVAIARVAGIGRQVKVSVYRVASKGGSIPECKLLWETKVAEWTGGKGLPTLCFIEPPWRLLYQNGNDFVMAGVEAKTSHSFSRNIFNSEQEGYNAVLKIPNRPLGLIVSGDVGIVMNSNGEPEGSTVRLDSIRGPFMDIAAIQDRILIINGDGFHIFGIGSGGLEQSIPLPHVPNHMKSAGWRFSNPCNSQGQTVLAYAADGAWMLKAMSLERQVAEALNHGQPGMAASILKECGHANQWYYQAMVQCAILFIEGMCIADCF